jgi:hypothetical protein
VSAVVLQRNTRKREELVTLAIPTLEGPISLMLKVFSLLALEERMADDPLVLISHSGVFLGGRHSDGTGELQGSFH